MNSNQPTIETRYFTILILWFGMITSVLIFLGITFVVPATGASDARFSLILNCAGIMPLALSFLLKSQVLAKAVQQQRLDQVQVAYVLSFALSEMAALLGLVDHFANRGSYFYVGFILAGLGLLLHFPLKKYLLAASGQEF